MCFLILGQSVRLKKTKKKSQNRRPGTPASLLWSLETTRHEHKIYMAEAFVAVIVKSRQHGGKDQPPKLLCNLPASLTFQQEFFVSNKYSQKRFLVQHRVATLQGYVGLKIIVMNRPV